MQIRSKLFIVMISLVTISIVVPSVVALNTFTSSLETEITDELKQEAISSMDKLSRLMFERIADLEFLSDPGNLVISGTESNNFTTAEKVEYLRKIETANKAYASISLYDRNGIKIGDTRSLGLGNNGSNEPFYKDVIDDDAGSTIYYDKVPTFSSDLQQYVIHFSAPIHDVKNNQTGGVLVLTFPLNKINNIMSEAGGSVSSNIDIELLADDGRIIYSNTDQKSVLKKKVTNNVIFDKLRNSSDKIETVIASPSENNNDNDDSNGTGKMILIGAKEPGYLAYKGNNWSSILAVNTEDAFKEVTLLRNQFIMIAVIILGISIVLIFIFARSISRPIIKLRDITNEVSKGNFDTKIESRKGGGSDELAQLTSSFEHMRQTIVDKTRDLLKANEELKQKDRLKDEFINIAAHELRTPIQPILTLSDVLRDKLRNRANNISNISISGNSGSSNSNNNAPSAMLDPEVEHILDIIIKDAKRLSRLSQGILDVARIESKEFDLTLQRFDIVSALSDFVIDSKRQIAKDRQDLNLIFEPEADGAIYVNADRDKIIQVVSNLLNNAIKFTKDGTIHVRVGINPQNEKEVVISVKDTGVGIDPTVLPELFTKYSSRSIGGIGLGLYISKNIVEAHDGRIWVENNADGKGVTFLFTLLLSL